MKFLSYGKDGGPESTVHGYWLIEIKGLFSIVLLKFENGSRDAYHNHAFNAVSWVLSGQLIEYFPEMPPEFGEAYSPSFKPVVTPRTLFHKVVSQGNTWVLSFRGPWTKTWREWSPKTGIFTTLTHGRKEV